MSFRKVNIFPSAAKPWPHSQTQTVGSPKYFLPLKVHREQGGRRKKDDRQRDDRREGRGEKEREIDTSL